MSLQKHCPFHFFPGVDKETICRKSECELWSTETSMCTISMGMNAILSVADALRGISENIKNHYPE